MTTSSQRDRVRVWDPLVRVFHWLLVAGFTANYLLNEAGGDWHIWIGYSLMALIGLRLLWGFVGPWSARWSSFWPTPSRLRAYRAGASVHRAEPAPAEERPRITHTPLGALMMLTLLALMVGLGVTGYMMEDTVRFWGVEWVKTLHETMANAIAVLVPLHVLGAVLESRRRRDNLVAGMIHGYHRLPEREPPSS
ncbi:cytochrome b/b6 domain-containing protein [Halomonas getboli]|uniref:cytochrome b/b6 domain-containing protein n=1 Tax=Halomonas getboli TaxID=2935862 RepID=UPI001FFED312|nr:cytochrome b/b6 domain-containing protein [Halomonas getboli]MCK2185173.1 cytochrome b/b6 domain-containing protein [Halomonas getboli]